jgi:hypothetical protein
LEERITSIGVENRDHAGTTSAGNSESQERLSTIAAAEQEGCKNLTLFLKFIYSLG